MVRNYCPVNTQIRAIQWTGDNLEEVKEFLGDAYIDFNGNTIRFGHDPTHELDNLATVASCGYYIYSIKHGKFFRRMDPDRFEKLYEEIII